MNQARQRVHQDTRWYPSSEFLLYNFIYEQDIRARGDPANTDHQVSEFNAAMPSWYAPVRTHCANILPNPKNPQRLLQASSSAQYSSRKRRLEDEEVEEPGGEEQ
ncbi:hypothetical protein C8F04DRAFT_1189478 [Mycena alexandri]|uniref:Uncharacterized protein n=1 Tax=Mycena alexandri TaxID=1745969 RepID=A0AAD6SHC9_9AGAR|nr:hypothetical protein C8F04DRAFT_1189478 [Mycena alexandri]